MKQLSFDLDRAFRRGLLKELSFAGNGMASAISLKAVIRAIEDAGPVCWLAQKNIAQSAGCSLKTTKRAITHLRALSYLVVCDDEERKRMNPQGFKTLHLRIVWSEIENAVRRQKNTSISMGSVANPMGSVCPPMGSVCPSYGVSLSPQEGQTDLQIEKNHKEPPPTSGASWGEVEEILFSAGCSNASRACHSAKERGCTPDHVLALVTTWKNLCTTRPERFKSAGYALFLRVKSATPSLDATQGWLGSDVTTRPSPNPKPSKAKTEDDVRWEARNVLLRQGVRGEALIQAVDEAAMQWRSINNQVLTV